MNDVTKPPHAGAIGFSVRPRLDRALLAITLLAGAALSQAQTSSPPPADDTLTYKGITLYGIVDVGVQYDSHAVPFSDYYPAGSADIVQKNSNRSELGVTPSNLSQSRIGLSGNEPLVGDWAGVFKLETFFNPQSGEISDGVKSLVQNNGRSLTCTGVPATTPCATQTTNLDSSVAGQLFIQALVGFSSPTYGSLTLGRQNTLLADGISKYDPQGASQAFSLIGLSGTTAGGGDTQNRRFDQSLKYTGSFAGFHLGAQYKFNGASGAANTATQFQMGYEIGKIMSIAAFYSRIKDAVAASALSAVQVGELPALGFSSSNSVAATISDNTTYGLMGMVSFGAPKFFAGYEHIKFANPSTPLQAGFDDIGGYKLAFVNNTAFDNNKILQVYWAGIRLSVGPNFELIGAYYGYHQNSFATGSHAGCTDASSSGCSGTENVVSISGDYQFTKRFDVYAGAMYSSVQNGLASGFLSTNNVNPTLGLRFRF